MKLEKVKCLLKEYKLFIIGFIIGFILTWVPMPYYVEGPGGLISLENRFSINGEKPENYSLAYVSSYRGTIFNILLSFIKKDYDIYPETKESGNNKEVDYRNHLMLEEANDDAVIYAYQRAGKNVNIVEEELYITYLDEEAKTDLKIGDRLLSVEGVEVLSKTQLATILTNMGLKKIQIEVMRDGKKKSCYAFLQEIDGRKIIGVIATAKRKIEIDPEISFTFEASESGASGGFMTTLAIYDMLVEEDISRGFKIAGTGTIDAFGNVGEIGGVKYKILGALEDEVDIFFVPKENYAEAITTRDKHKKDLNIVSISTFDEALTYLKKYEG